jgi:hypothetical protein
MIVSLLKSEPAIATDNHRAGIFQVILSLWPPRKHLLFYTSHVCQYLATSQKDHVWAMLNDAEYFVDSLVNMASRYTALSALESIPPSPSARHAIIQRALLSDGTDQIILPLYALCDISDSAARVALTKMTYTRLFEERLEVYKTLINATQASKSVQEFITTIKFFVPRIKNEIPPDAGRLPSLFSEPIIVDLLRLATEEEAAEIASIYVAWENQVNEAVSPVGEVYLLNTLRLRLYPRSPPSLRTSSASSTVVFRSSQQTPLVHFSRWHSRFCGRDA